MQIIIFSIFPKSSIGDVGHKQTTPRREASKQTTYWGRRELNVQQPRPTHAPWEAATREEVGDRKTRPLRVRRSSLLCHTRLGRALSARRLLAAPRAPAWSCSTPRAGRLAPGLPPCLRPTSPGPSRAVQTAARGASTMVSTVTSKGSAAARRGRFELCGAGWRGAVGRLGLSLTALLPSPQFEETVGNKWFFGET